MDLLSISKLQNVIDESKKELQSICPSILSFNESNDELTIFPGLFDVVIKKGEGGELNVRYDEPSNSESVRVRFHSINYESLLREICSAGEQCLMGGVFFKPMDDKHPVYSGGSSYIEVVTDAESYYLPYYGFTNRLESIISYMVKEKLLKFGIIKDSTRDSVFPEYVTIDGKGDRINYYDLVILLRKKIFYSTYKISLGFKSQERTKKNSNTLSKLLLLNMFKLLDSKALSFMYKIHGFGLIEKFQYLDYLYICKNIDDFAYWFNVNPLIAYISLPSVSKVIYAGDKPYSIGEKIKVVQNYIEDIYGPIVWKYIIKLGTKHIMIAQNMFNSIANYASLGCSVDPCKYTLKSGDNYEHYKKEREYANSFRSPKDALFIFGVSVIQNIALNDANFNISMINSKSAVFYRLISMGQDVLLYIDKTEENFKKTVEFTSLLISNKEMASINYKKWYHKVKYLTRSYYIGLFDWYREEGCKRGVKYFKNMWKLSKSGKKSFYYKIDTISDKWHKGVYAKIVSDEDFVFWDTLFDKSKFETKELIITELNSSSLLSYEGKRMCHCVGTYIGPCISKRSNIFHVADKIRHEEATLEVDHNSYIIKQFLGFEDGLVSSRLENLVKIWLKNMDKRTDIDIVC